MIYIARAAAEEDSFYFELEYEKHIITIRKYVRKADNFELAFSSIQNMGIIATDPDLEDYAAYETIDGDGVVVAPLYHSPTYPNAIPRMKRVQQNPIALLWFYEGNLDKFNFRIIAAAKALEGQIVREKKELHRDIILEEFPESKIGFMKKDAKSDLFMDVDLPNSLSYLEAQMDFISKTVFFLMEQFPGLKEQLNGYEDYKKAILKNSVLNIKDNTNCVEEIIKNKAKVRKAQKTYYQNKQSMKGDTGE